MQILIPILFLAGVYLLLLRPQQQRVRRQKDLITAIGVGDRVVTAGGLIGRVVDMTDDRLLLEVADGVVLELLRLAVSRRLDETESSFEAMGSALDDESEEEEYGEEEYGEAGEGGAAESAEAEAEAGSQAVGQPGGHEAGGQAGGHEPVEAESTPEPPTPTISDGTIEQAAAPAPGQDPH